MHAEMTWHVQACLVSALMDSSQSYNKKTAGNTPLRRLKDIAPVLSRQSSILPDFTLNQCRKVQWFLCHSF